MAWRSSSKCSLRICVRISLRCISRRLLRALLEIIDYFRLILKAMMWGRKHRFPLLDGENEVSRDYTNCPRSPSRARIGMSIYFLTLTPRFLLTTGWLRADAENNSVFCPTPDRASSSPAFHYSLGSSGASLIGTTGSITGPLGGQDGLNLKPEDLTKKHQTSPGDWMSLPLIHFFTYVPY